MSARRIICAAMLAVSLVGCSAPVVTIGRAISVHAAHKS